MWTAYDDLKKWRKSDKKDRKVLGEIGEEMKMFRKHPTKEEMKKRKDEWAKMREEAKNSTKEEIELLDLQIKLLKEWEDDKPKFEPDLDIIGTGFEKVELEIDDETGEPISHEEFWGDEIEGGKIHHPNHYNEGIEAWDYIISHNMNFLEGNIIKYITRYKHKNGLEDLKKVRQYLDKLIETEYGEEK